MLFPSYLQKPFLIKIISVIILCCLGVLIYSNTFHSPFHFDDQDSIVTNINIRDLSNLKAIWDFWPTRFITYLSLAFNYRFGGLNVWGYHLFNLLVHLICAILVYWLAGLIFSRNYPAFFAGLIFLAHPIQTESVNYIIQRSGLLAALFYLACLCLYVKSRLRESEKRGLIFAKFYYLGSLLAMLAAMFSKETAITLPFMLLLGEFYTPRSIQLLGPRGTPEAYSPGGLHFFRKGRGINWQPVIPFLLGSAVIPLTMFLTKSVNLSKMHRIAELPSGISPLTYLLTQFKVIVTYLRLLFLPINQNLDFDYPLAKGFWEPSVLFSFLLITLIIFFAIRGFKKNKLVSFAIFWFFLTLLPESSIIPIKDVIFEHRLYLPMFGYSIFMASAIDYCSSRRNPRLGVAGLSALVIIYSCLTYSRNFLWQDKFSLWDDAVDKSAGKSRPYQNRAAIFLSDGEYSRAIADYNRALEIDPDSAEAYYYRGLSYLLGGNPKQATADFNRALALSPKYTEIYNNRGLSYLFGGKLDEAIADFNRAIASRPNLGLAYKNRAVAYFLKGEYEKSWADVHRAQALGSSIDFEFLTKLKAASKREK